MYYGIYIQRTHPWIHELASHVVHEPWPPASKTYLADRLGGVFAFHREEHLRVMRRD